MLNDILLDANGDILINDGDIALTDAVGQAVRTRLLWVRGEYSLLPGAGMEHHNENSVREKLLAVEGINSVDELSVDFDKSTRRVTVRFRANAETNTESEGGVTWQQT